MKKIFIGECMIIVALLFVIGSLLGTRETKVWGKDLEESDLMIEESTQVYPRESTESGLVQYARDILGEGFSGTVSGSDGSVSGNQVSGNQVSGNSLVKTSNPLDDGELKIAVFADSIWNAARGAGSVGEQVGSALGATVYNCAIGGTSAAVIHGDSTNVLEGWKSQSLNGMMYVARGELSADGLLSNTAAYEPAKAADFNEMDYLVIAYGLNDFFSGVKIYPQDMYDMKTYIGALRHAIDKMKETYPHLKIILIAPTYSEARTEFSIGSLEEYVEAARQVAAECGTYFLDMYHDMGVNSSNKDQYLQDGVHLNMEGRKLYAQDVAQLILNIEALE